MMNTVGSAMSSILSISMRSGGNGESEKSAAARIVRRPEHAAVRLHQLAADRQPDAQATGLGRVEGLEDPLQIAFGDAAAGIGDVDLNLVPLVERHRNVD